MKCLWSTEYFIACWFWTDLLVVNALRVGEFFVSSGWIKEKNIKKKTCSHSSCLSWALNRNNVGDERGSWVRLRGRLTGESLWEIVVELFHCTIFASLCRPCYNVSRDIHCQKIVLFCFRFMGRENTGIYIWVKYILR